MEMVLHFSFRKLTANCGITHVSNARAHISMTDNDRFKSASCLFLVAAGTPNVTAVSFASNHCI